VRIRIRPQAIDDLSAARQFYESQQPGLGDYFLSSLFEDIDTLVEHAGIHPVTFGSYHRLLASRFPFAVYYRIQGDDVLVQAILDCRQNPQRTERRFSRS